MENLYSPLHLQRLKYQPKLPLLLRDFPSLEVKEVFEQNSQSDLHDLFPKTWNQKSLFLSKGASKQKYLPLNIGVVFSGGPASGGHNVLAGLYDGLKKLHRESRLWGFLGGPSGIIENQKKEITASLIDAYRNMGGFDLIQTGRTKIEKDEQFASSLKTVKECDLDGLIIIGGDDSNTNAALLSEYFLKHEVKTKIIGVPKTIDGDLRAENLEISFGFDTATKVYSELIGNICRDCLSAKKYYHFIKLMGRSASHITLECALATHPNIALIGEEIEAMGTSLSDIITHITDLICKRAQQGKQYGVILIPEGLIEFIPEMKVLIKELNTIIAHKTIDKAKICLSKKSAEVFALLPSKIQDQILMERDPHGNVQLSLIATDELILDLVKNALQKRSEYKGKFTAINHFFGYEGRCSFPSNFDAQYCYSIGHVAALLVNSGHTGYLATVYNLSAGIEQWEGGGIPLTSMIHREERLGKKRAVIKKALVNLNQAPFQLFARLRNSWSLNDHYRYPGPIQFFGEEKLTDTIPHTVELLSQGAFSENRQ